MASIVVTGGGIVALTTAMLLADDGHDVTVLERDPAPVPEPSEAWETWERRGVNQFRLPHLFLARFRIELERGLPRVIKALEQAGALRLNPMAETPAEFTGGWREDDGAFEFLTGRRPVMEAAIAAVAQSTPGVTVRRGVAGGGLVGASVTGSHAAAVPHVVGVRTTSGEEVLADLVVDATGRRSAVPDWIKALGAQPPEEELEDSGFVYYGRHFRAPDGAIPPAFGPGLMDHGSISTLTLPADNGTWSVVVVASAKDSALRRLRDVEKWSAVVKSLPLVAHWIEGEPLEDGVMTMSKTEDRHRRYFVDGRPVVTGVVALADAWACTNPSLGRGVSIGTLHGFALRDVLRESGVGDPTAFAAAFDEATMRAVEPWYRATLSYDRHRLAEVEAEIRGVPYEADDPQWEITKSLQYAAGQDPECLRAFVSIVSVLGTPDEVLARPGLLDKVLSAGADWREAERLGPSRSELVSIAGS